MEIGRKKDRWRERERERNTEIERKREREEREVKRFAKIIIARKCLECCPKVRR